MSFSCRFLKFLACGTRSACGVLSFSKIVITSSLLMMYTGICCAASAQAAQINELLATIDADIYGMNSSLIKTLNMLFYLPNDPFFPEPLSVSQKIIFDPIRSSNTLSSSWTTSHIASNLQSVAFNLKDGYKILSLAHQQEMPQSVAPLPNIADLTLGKPSYDSLFLPPGVCQQNSDFSDCQVSEKIAQSNAHSMNFDYFLANASSVDDHYDSLSKDYMNYVLEKFNSLVDGKSQTGSEPFLSHLNEKLKSTSDPEKAERLLHDVLTNKEFQKYWIKLRAFQAAQSILISNFSYLAAERMPQKDLGKAYGLNQNDASPKQVESALLNNTIYNPEWYKKMQTATPAVLQKEQLLLTSLLLRLMQEQLAISERSLAVQQINAKFDLDQSRQNIHTMEDTLNKELLSD